MGITKSVKGGATITKQAKAGLTLSVSRVERKLRLAKVAKQYGGKGTVFTAGVVEHVLGKIMADAAALAAMSKSKKIGDSHIIAVVRGDPDLARLFAGYAFSSTSEVPKAIEYILTAEEQKARQDKMMRSLASKAAQKQQQQQSAGDENEAANA
jgi:hypothetical protein